MYLVEDSPILVSLLTDLIQLSLATPICHLRRLPKLPTYARMSKGSRDFTGPRGVRKHGGREELVHVFGIHEHLAFTSTIRLISLWWTHQSGLYNGRIRTERPVMNDCITTSPCQRGLTTCRREPPMMLFMSAVLSGLLPRHHAHVPASYSTGKITAPNTEMTRQTSRLTGKPLRWWRV